VTPRLAAVCRTAVLLASWLSLGSVSAQVLDFTPAERRAILDHGPWPETAVPDTSNRRQGDAASVALGQRLFFDTGLSGDGRVACATCHQPGKAFQDGLSTAVGEGRGVRNTIGLMDAAGQRWSGWDGGTDSLWAASVRPLLNPREMGASAANVAAHVRADPLLAGLAGPGATDDAVLAEVGKALAAYQATLVSPRSAFDDFRDALARGDLVAAARYPLAAQRGLKLFVGRARCALCHAGPRFTHGEFADIGVPFFVTGGVDPGRHGGLRALLADPFNRLGPHADDGGQGAVATRHVRQAHRHFGEFKVPGLRQLRHTAPYMHAGSHATLAEVVRHYDQLDEERLHADGERILQPLGLSAAEAADLQAFLLSLSD
jgi:cytochrome c peroxidase